MILRTRGWFNIARASNGVRNANRSVCLCVPVRSHVFCFRPTYCLIVKFALLISNVCIIILYVALCMLLC